MKKSLLASLAAHLSLFAIIYFMVRTASVQTPEPSQANSINRGPITITVVGQASKKTDMDRFRERLQRQAAKERQSDCAHFFGGIGIESTVNGWITRVINGYPAARAGIQKGDIITYPEINGIIGEIGTQIAVTVNRDGRDITFNLTREKICYENENQD